MEIVRVISTELSPRGYEVRELFERAGIPYGFYLDDSEAGRRLLAEVGAGDRRPVVIIGRERVLIDPSNVEIVENLGVIEPEGPERD